MKIMNRLVLVVAMFGIASATVAKAADGDFKKKHPRRAEVIGREKNEVKKNNEAEASGKITQKQANRLNKQDARIKKEEQRDAAKNGGHITKAEQNHLNREENNVNRERNAMEKRDAAKKTKPVSAPAQGGTAPTQPSTGTATTGATQ